jgi:hypothetical protein
MEAKNWVYEKNVAESNVVEDGLSDGSDGGRSR